MFQKNVVIVDKVRPSGIVKSKIFWSSDMLHFLDNRSRNSCPSDSVYTFSRRKFPMLYSINWPNFIVWLPLLFEILGNMCIAIVCFLGCDVITFEINIIFLINPVFYLTKKSR